MTSRRKKTDKSSVIIAINIMRKCFLRLLPEDFEFCWKFIQHIAVRKKFRSFSHGNQKFHISMEIIPDNEGILNIIEILNQCMRKSNNHIEYACGTCNWDDVTVQHINSEVTIKL